MFNYKQYNKKINLTEAFNIKNSKNKKKYIKFSPKPQQTYPLIYPRNFSDVPLINLQFDLDF